MSLTLATQCPEYLSVVSITDMWKYVYLTLLIKPASLKLQRRGELRNAYKILVGNSERKTPFRRYWRKLENDIRIDLTEVMWEVVVWIHLAQDKDQYRAVVNTAMNHLVP
jgi:hypothetical protein